MEAKQTLLLLSGLPGSGKSREALGWVATPGDNPRARINYDDLRIELGGPNFVFSREFEKMIKQTARERAERLIESGYDIVIDNCNLNEWARAPWKSMAAKYAMTLEQQEIDTPVSICVAQDRRREGRAHVGRAVIERMALFNGFIDWTDKHLYHRDFVIVDMDGTVANCDKRRNDAIIGTSPEGKVKLNWDKFYEGVENDPPIEPIVKLVKKLAIHYDILAVSGRPTDKAGKGTEKWLEKHIDIGWSFRHLFMRAAMDSRPDYVIKKEILDLLPKERIAFALDDRDQVVQMWRANGVTCLQVADGDF